MPYAKVNIPKRIQHKRWARNGHVPDAWPIRQAAAALNHCAAYRRRQFLSASAPWDTMATGAGSVTVWRSCMRTGLAVSQLRFRMIIGLAQTGFGGGGSAADPYVEISVTPSGGSPETKASHYGAHDGSLGDDAPNQMANRELRFDVDPTTVYEIAVTAVDGARPLAVTGYEWAEPTIDESRPPFVELQPTVWQPILDSIRQKILGGLSNAWLNNSIHLLTWPGLGTGSARSVTGTTWVNAVDGTSTSVSAATPGYYFGAEGVGDGALTDLVPWCRLKDGPNLPVTFAVFANTNANSNGQVRIADSSGAKFTLTGVGVTPQWYTLDTTLANVDAIAGSGKLDLQVRNGNGGETTNLFAASLWIRAA